MSDQSIPDRPGNELPDTLLKGRYAIEREVRTSDVVIPLLSQASISSEMLAYEIQIAHDAAQRQSGKPRLVPVRVG
ncbi:MAG: toll/interleukin-1 receptor domain-containing protein [Acidobacteria bacterium]|nr:toll/interleukin-1 receptor domain-containing protein [Acidobacteriota bacterium]MCW5971545.1 toll/interleukin-1 receptor domain-containing protein [Blastocatellales bacterium]